MPSRTFGAPALLPVPGQRLSEKTLVAQSRSVSTSAVEPDRPGRTIGPPGPLVRASAGDFLRVSLDNQLPSRHHDPLARDPAAQRRRRRARPDPGPDRLRNQMCTSSPHPTGHLLLPPPRRGPARPRPAAPMIIDGRTKPATMTPSGSSSSMTGSAPAPHPMTSSKTHRRRRPRLLRRHGRWTAGRWAAWTMGRWAECRWGRPVGRCRGRDLPVLLINGKPPTDPDVLTAKPGQRIRLRVINAASDTIFTVTLGGHRLTITHSDGHAVEPTEVGAFYIGMVNAMTRSSPLGDGVFPARGPPVRPKPAADRRSRWSAPAAAARPASTLLRPSCPGRSSSAPAAAGGVRETTGQGPDATVDLRCKADEALLT